MTTAPTTKPSTTKPRTAAQVVKNDALETPPVPAVRLVDPVAAAARQKLHDIETELNATFAEREREIRGLMLAIAAGEHVLLLGPAGTGKSALAQALCTAINGGNYFEWLLTRFSTPEELFGPVSLDGLKHDEYRRVTKGKLPEATVGFLDEIFKANSAILNALLTILNERKFDNNGTRHEVPLETLVGASNELPEGPELAALFDRFLLRFWTGYTKEQASFERLLTGGEPTITATIDLAEIHAAQEECAQVFIPTSTIEELFKLRAELQGAGCVVSDRRWRKAAKILRAAAWLEGAAEVTPDVFPVLANVLWDLPDQQSTIATKVARYASAELAEAQEVFDAITQLANELPGADTPEYAQRVSGVTRDMKKAVEKIGTLGKAAKPAIRVKIEAVGAELDRKYKALREQAAKALGL